MFGKKKQSPAIEETVKQSKNFEVTIVETIKKSERRAWIVAISAMLMAVLLAAGYLFVMPLKEKIPYVLTVDTLSGQTSIATVTGGYQAPNAEAQEIVDKSHISKYIISRESYDQRLLYRRDGNVVLSMSEPDVATAYINLFEEKNPKSPEVLYGDMLVMRIKIRAITFVSPGTALVKFDRFLIDKKDYSVKSSDSRTASLTYEYRDNLKLNNEELQMENPLGFRVTAYRTDSDGSTGAAVLKQSYATEGVLPSPQPITTPVASAAASSASGATSTLNNQPAQ